VPWCETCDRFYNPNTLRDDGTCPTCGRDVGRPPVATATVDGEVPGVPWHFKLLLLATVLYLGWRLVQGVVWVAEHL
jgi:hypothetical protein